MSGELLILGWHNVESSWCFPSREGAGERGLWHQLSLVKRFRTVVDLEDALDDLADERPLPPRATALTFDDGYRDNLTLAVPMLASLGLRATFFLVPALLSGERVGWWEDLGRAFTTTRRTSVEWRGARYSLGDPTTRRAVFDMVSGHLKELPIVERSARVASLLDELEPEADADPNDLFLDWDGAAELARTGHAIGSHSLRHAILANETPTAQAVDLSTAKDALERGLDVEAPLLAYPNGSAVDFDEATEAAAAACGHRAGVTTIEGWNDSTTPTFRLHRFELSPERGGRSLLRLTVQHHRQRPAVARAG